MLDKRAISIIIIYDNQLLYIKYRRDRSSTRVSVSIVPLDLRTICQKRVRGFGEFRYLTRRP